MAIVSSLPHGRLARIFRRLRGHGGAPVPLAERPSIPVPAGSVQVLAGPEAFRTELMARIRGARRRIYVVALYVQDDTAGRELMEALYAAHRAHPDLEIQVLVDEHRARRGLIGKAKSPGNMAMYQAFAARYGDGVKVAGVPVQTRELFGVLHLKGIVIDDALLYSGASLSDVYLARNGKYRLDRYHLFESAPLAECMAALVRTTLLASPAVCPLNLPEPVPKRGTATAIRAFRRNLRGAAYAPAVGQAAGPGEVSVTPLVGFGAGNQLNETILTLLKKARRNIVLYTPYFNLPMPVRRILAHQLALGLHVTIVMGDKTANDFYLPPSEPFKTIGLLPYLYEANLRRFARTHQEAITQGRLNLCLWRQGDNTFHLKGVFIDDNLQVITGNNLNPRAWNFDLENGLVLRDPEGLLAAPFGRERATIMEHTRRLGGPHDLETPGAYPPKVQKALKRMTRTRLDRLVNHLL